MWIVKGSEENMFILTSIRSEQSILSPEVQLLILHVDPDELLQSLELLWPNEADREAAEAHLAATDVESPRPIFFLKEPS